MGQEEGSGEDSGIRTLVCPPGPRGFKKGALGLRLERQGPSTLVTLYRFLTCLSSRTDIAPCRGETKAQREATAAKGTQNQRHFPPLPTPESCEGSGSHQEPLGQ